MRIKQRRIEHAKNTIICHLIINSIRNKFDTLDEIEKAFGIFLTSESKVDNTLNVPFNLLTDHPVFSDLELMAFELHQSKPKWLLLGSYKPASENDIEFLNRRSSIINYYEHMKTFWQ